jgi:hypothetical protein
MKKFKVIINNLLLIVVILVGVIDVCNQDKC